jgi:hypothetical protein
LIENVLVENVERREPSMQPGVVGIFWLKLGQVIWYMNGAAEFRAAVVWQ